jgi:hypothetical protein
VDTVGGAKVAGTVVIATVTGTEANDAPVVFVAVTVTVYVTPEDSAWTTIGEEELFTVLVVCPDAAAVTAKEVADGEFSGNEKDTVIAPLLKSLLVPKFIADILVGASGRNGP